MLFWLRVWSATTWLRLRENLSPGDVLMLENSRFEPGETKNDPALAAELASLADVYVNDAFGAAHRAHASTEGVAHLVSDRAAGLLLESEVTALTGLLEDRLRGRFVAVLGGAKVSDKIGVIERFCRGCRRGPDRRGYVLSLLGRRGAQCGEVVVRA